MHVEDLALNKQQRLICRLTQLMLNNTDYLTFSHFSKEIFLKNLFFLFIFWKFIFYSDVFRKKNWLKNQQTKTLEKESGEINLHPPPITTIFFTKEKGRFIKYIHIWHNSFFFLSFFHPYEPAGSCQKEKKIENYWFKDLKSGILFKINDLSNV